jgi:two-component system NarL family sensor kinase
VLPGAQHSRDPRQTRQSHNTGISTLSLVKPSSLESFAQSTGLKHWRSSLFWRFLSAMLLASCLGTAIAIYVTSVVDNHRVINALRSPALEHALQAEGTKIASLLADSSSSTQLCEVVLRASLENVLTSVLPDTQGPNRIWRALEDGRAFISYARADGQTCRYPNATDSAWITGSTGHASAPLADLTEQPEGQSKILSVRPAANSDATLTLGVYVLSPVESLIRNRDVSWSTIGLFVLLINFCSVITLVPLLVRRIKAAEHAASVWTQGDLSARIDDSSGDEFGHLTNSFDRMADALSGVIEMKQALAASNERNRLARDLHDTAKQRAFALGLQLTALKKLSSGSPESTRIASAALALISHVQQDLSDIIKRLSAPTIAEIGLGRAVSEGIDALLAGSNTNHTLILCPEDEQAIQDAPDVARQLLLISIEASANVLKHARARTLDVAIKRNGDLYSWSIIDDGCGFDTRRDETFGMGLANMRLRANSLPEGRLTLITSPGNGTAITVTFRTK